jgi:hypothetical protein
MQCHLSCHSPATSLERDEREVRTHTRLTRGDPMSAEREERNTITSHSALLHWEGQRGLDSSRGPAPLYPQLPDYPNTSTTVRRAEQYSSTSSTSIQAMDTAVAADYFAKSDCLAGKGPASRNLRLRTKPARRDASHRTTSQNCCPMQYLKSDRQAHGWCTMNIIRRLPLVTRAGPYFDSSTVDSFFGSRYHALHAYSKESQD